MTSAATIPKKVAILGKSTVNPTHPAYIFTKELAYLLVKEGKQVLHGGYQGGVMQAVAKGAYDAAVELKTAKVLSIGVPEQRFDRNWQRTKNTTFLAPALDICERLRHIVLDADAIVIAPQGGDGTMLELQLAMHENLLAQNEKQIKPIVICQLPNCTNWKEILNMQLSLLDKGLHSTKDLPWLRFADTPQAAMLFC